MLTDFNRLRTVYKNFKGWGSTHPERETFEELYRSYQQISTNSVLTYGDILPRKESDQFFNDIKSLDFTNNTFYYTESSFRTIPLVKKWVDCELTPISPNCDHSFVILNKDGEQIKNIIPFDFSDTGLYNYTLTDHTGVEIPWGLCDWIVDVNSSLLTFNNGTPENINASNPPRLTFFQYIGPVGERHYLDAVLLDLETAFESENPVCVCTNEVKELLDKIEIGFFNKHTFNGDDNTQGIGLQYNLLTEVIETETGDHVKGYDDNSKAQVVSLLSHRIGSFTDSVHVVTFVSEDLEPNTYDVQIPEESSPEFSTKYRKINVDKGFIITNAKPGNYKIVVENDSDLKAVLLVKDDKTQDFELFKPRADCNLTIKIPVFVDMITLPPHLKLTSLASYSDHITPQYYGPRVADFVIAAVDSVNNRSADYIVYNKPGFYLSDGLKDHEGCHIFLRDGTYETTNETLTFPADSYIHGESRRKVVIKNTKLVLNADSAIENVTFIDCEITIKSIIALKVCDFISTPVYVENGPLPATILACTFEDLSIDGNETINGSQIQRLTVTGSASLFGCAVTELAASKGSLEIFDSYVKKLQHTEGVFYVHSSRIGILDCTYSEPGSILNTTAVEYVENLVDTIKIDTSYITRFSDKIDRRIYPDEATIPYYSSFERRVYTKLPDPFLYDEETNKLNLKLDTIEHTIFINEKGELQTRFFSGDEIWLSNPDDLKTQIEDKYLEHADTRIDHPKPVNVNEALVELFWSKADLRNGKIPIDQLPDSVAYGGIQFVGMWSFEDSNGAFPQFSDCNLDFASDDEYTDLQNGWFFIVKASHKEDDPVYPQQSSNGVEWTAGDWCIYAGGKTHQIDYSKPIRFTYNGIEATVLNTGDESITYQIPVKNSRSVDKNDSLGDSVGDSNDSIGDSVGDSNDSIGDSIGGLGNFATITTDFEGAVTKVFNLVDIEIGSKLRDLQGVKTLEVQYVLKSEGDRWVKLDRAYLDPVYSRLPEFATKTGAENPAWSIDDGGTGLLKLSYKSLAEAIRLINEALLKLSPDRPVSIQEITTILDTERTTAIQREYIKVGPGLQLNQLVEVEPEKAWCANSGSVYFTQTGEHTYLPLECCFYSGKKSDIKVFDRDVDITDNCFIDTFDPYERYHLGFRTPTVMDAAEITGSVKLGKGSHIVNHSIVFEQKNLEPTSQVTDDVSSLEGRSASFNFVERKFYLKNSDTRVIPCNDTQLNSRVLNILLSTYRTGGYGYIPTGTVVSGSFIIDTFTKYGTVSPDAKVVVTATFEGIELPVTLTAQTLNTEEPLEEVYNLEVGFSVDLPKELDYYRGTLVVKAQAFNWGQETANTQILKIEDMTLINPNTIPEIVESGATITPKFGTNVNTFGSEYQVKTYNSIRDKPELVFETDGFRWPTVSRYLETVSVENPIYVEKLTNGYNIDERPYRFITFRRTFDRIHDLCGFNVHLDWGDVKPNLDPLTGVFSTILLQICVRSGSLQNIDLQDGNKPVPIFFTANFNVDEPCNYPGKSDVSRRRITFGRKPVPIEDIYIRVGIPQSNYVLKGVSVTVDD